MLKKRLDPLRTWLLVVGIIFSLLTVTGCTKTDTKVKEIEPVAETTFLMGTVAKITIYDEIRDKEIFQNIFERISDIEKRMTINDPQVNSEIMRLNEAAGKEEVQLSDDTFNILQKAKHFSELSQGNFDITIGPIVKLWNIGMDNARVPTQEEIAEKLPLVNYQDLILDEEKKTAFLKQEGMQIDLGAIAKGYAADEAARVLKEAGIKHAIVNLGGNVLTINTKPDGSLWRLGLQDPYEPRGKSMGVVLLNNQTLVSSGTYERNLEWEGEVYHHLLSPEDGYPAQNGLVSVSIITRESVDADALSTAAFLLGLEDGMKLIEELPDTEAIFITEDRKVYTTSGISEANFEITNESYVLQN